MNQIIFLDIDGVLNNSNIRCPRIDPEAIARLNRILDHHTDAKIVLSSSWRFMVNRGLFTLVGFNFLLQSHGLNGYNRVIDMTPVPITDRSRAILAWVDYHKPTVWIALDDERLSLGPYQFAAYHLDGQVGITDKATEWAIKMLALLETQ